MRCGILVACVVVVGCGGESADSPRTSGSGASVNDAGADMDTTGGSESGTGGTANTGGGSGGLGGSGGPDSGPPSGSIGTTSSGAGGLGGAETGGSSPTGGWVTGGLSGSGAASGTSGSGGSGGTGAASSVGGQQTGGSAGSSGEPIGGAGGTSGEAGEAGGAGEASSTGGEAGAGGDPVEEYCNPPSQRGIDCGSGCELPPPDGDVGFEFQQYNCEQFCEELPSDFSGPGLGFQLGDLNPLDEASIVFPAVSESAEGCSECSYLSPEGHDPMADVAWSYHVAIGASGIDSENEACFRATASPGRLLSVTQDPEEALCGDMQPAQCAIGWVSSAGGGFQSRVTVIAPNPTPAGWLRVEIALTSGACQLTCP